MLDDDLAVEEISPGEIDMQVVRRDRSPPGRWLAVAGALIVAAVVANIAIGGSPAPSEDQGRSPTTTELAAGPDGPTDASIASALRASAIWTGRVGWTSLDLFGWRVLLDESCGDRSDQADEASNTSAAHAERVVSRYHLDRGVPVDTAQSLMQAVLAVGCADESDSVSEGDVTAAVSQLGVDYPIDLAMTEPRDLLIPSEFEASAGLVLSLRRAGTTAIVADPVALATVDGRLPDRIRLVPNEADLPVLRLDAGDPSRVSLPDELIPAGSFDLQVCSLESGGPCGVARFVRLTPGELDDGDTDAPPLIVQTLSGVWVDDVGWTSRSWREWGTIAGLGCEDEASADAIRTVVDAQPDIALGTTRDHAVHLIFQMAKANCRSRHPGPDAYDGPPAETWRWRGAFRPGGSIVRVDEDVTGVQIHHRPWGTTALEPMVVVSEIAFGARGSVVSLPSELAPGHYRVCPVGPVELACPQATVLPDGSIPRTVAVDGSVVLLVDPGSRTVVRGIDLPTGQTRWSRPLGDQNEVTAALELVDTVVLAMVRSGRDLVVTSLDRQTGESQWSATLEDPIANATRLSIDEDGHLLVETGDLSPGPADRVTRLDPATGLILAFGLVED